ncbi:ATP-binding cassette domain-containing protein [Christensenellaceae bacterium OttesenSCG-928-M15]|nr:ATP-binding cassette domain-containing protein [Christensenellaceae bacterium OttesenSCG-928-M15]
MIRLDKITAGYGELVVLNRFSLTLPQKGVVAVMGPSGSGKSTLFKVLASLLPIREGSIEGIKDKRISIVFQEDRLLPWRTAEENVSIPLSKEMPDRVERAREWLKKMELGDVLEEYPSSLSGGMQRRVALARAAAYGGDLLLCDEPFTGLDAPLRNRVAKELLNAAPLIVVITHDEEDAKAMGAQEIVNLHPVGG